MLRAKFVVLAIVLSLVVGLVAVSAADKPIELKLYWPMGKKALQWSTLVMFMDSVEKASDGRVKFKRYCCKAMGSAEDSTEAVRGGSLDITVVGIGTFGKYEPAINHVVLPYLFDDYDHVYRFVSSPLWFELTKGLEKHGLKPITNVNAGFRDLLTTKKPVKTVADLKGVKVKVAPIKPFLTVWEKLGAVVTPMKTTEQYMAMKTGVIQGVEMPPTNMVASKLCEVGKYYSFRIGDAKENKIRTLNI